MKSLPALAFMTVACTSTTPSGDDAPTDTDTVATGDTSTTDTDTDPVITLPQALSATLSDATGAPLTAWSIKFCNHIGCRIDETDGAGAFGYVNVTLDPHSLEPVPPEGSNYATMNLPYSFEQDEVKDLSFVAVELDPTTALSTTAVEIEMGTGLWVTVATGDLTKPDAFHPDPTTAGGVSVPTSAWPTIDDVSGTVLAMWHTHPFDYHAAAGLPVRIEGDLGLAEGATVDLLVGSYSDFAWVEAGSLMVTGGELVGAAKLPLLSTVIAVQR